MISNYKYKIFYNLESKQNKDDSKLLFFNMSYGFKVFDSKKGKYIYKPLRLSTQYSLKSEYWDKENKRLNSKGRRELGSDIDNLISKIEESADFHYKQLSKENGRKPTPAELKRFILVDLQRAEKESKYIGIIDFIKTMINRKTALPVTSNEHWKESTKVQYENLIRLLEIYEKEIKSNLTFSEITEDEYWKFFDVINNVYFQENQVYYTITNMSKFSKQLKTIFNAAENEEIKIGFNHKKRSIKIHPTETNGDTYLTEKQLEKIINEDVDNNPHFVEARNYIIISSFTGLRIDDMLHLNEINLESETRDGFNYQYFITKIRKATNKGTTLEVAIPILKPVQDLLIKNKNQFPKFSSQQSIRLNIKAFLKHLNFKDKITISKNYFLPVGVKKENTFITKPQYEVFTPHDCRSTFITNLINLPIAEAVIEPITHPKSVKQSIIKYYDKSSLIEKMILFVNELNKKNSDLYKY